MQTKIEVHTHVTPWRFDGHGINDNEGQRIAKVSCCEPYVYGDEGTQRNADFDRVSNLIAAAPEMLEALEHIVRCENGNMPEFVHSDTVRIAEAAIRKAKGE